MCCLIYWFRILQNSCGYKAQKELQGLNDEKKGLVAEKLDMKAEFQNLQKQYSDVKIFFTTEQPQVKLYTGLTLCSIYFRTFCFRGSFAWVHFPIPPAQRHPKRPYT